MGKFIQIFQVAIAILLMVSILAQNRGTALSGLFGGTDGVYRTKRGVEKVLFYSTIVLAALFFALAIINLIVIR